MTSFSGVTFVLFCFVFVFMFSLKSRPFVQSFFDMRAPIATRVVVVVVVVAVIFLFFVLGDAAFSEYFLYHCRFLFEWRARRTFFPSEWCFSTL